MHSERLRRFNPASPRAIGGTGQPRSSRSRLRAAAAEPRRAPRLPAPGRRSPAASPAPGGDAGGCAYRASRVCGAGGRSSPTAMMCREMVDLPDTFCDTERGNKAPQTEAGKGERRQPASGTGGGGPGGAVKPKRLPPPGPSPPERYLRENKK